MLKKLKQYNLYNIIPTAFRNKYIVIISLFLIWITFLDENNLIVLYERINHLEENKSRIENLKKENNILKERLNRLRTDPEELERFARENFLMKKEGEDIIIIRKKSNE